MGRHILVTDDESNIRYSSRIALRKAGYTVSEAANGEEALACIHDGADIDLMVLDLNMPRMSGETVVVILHERGVTLPIVVISGCTEGGVVKELMNRGCSAFLEKPFTPEELVRTIDSVFSARDTQLASGKATSEEPALSFIPEQSATALPGRFHE